MKKITIEEAKGGMYVGEDINDKSNQILIKAGVKLTERIIEKLKKEGIKNISILEEGEQVKQNNTAEDKDEGFIGLNFLENLKKKYGDIKKLNKQPKDTEKKIINKKEEEKQSKTLLKRERIDEKKPIVVIKKSAPKKEENLEEKKELQEFLKILKLDLKSMILNIKKEGSIIPFKLSENSLKTLNSIITNVEILKNVKKIKEYDEYLYNHSVYVSLISIIAGELFSYKPSEIYSLGIAGLLHDVGMTKVPKDIIDKKAVLKPDEREKVEKHTVESYNIMSKIKSCTELSKEITIDHHEKIDGTGYPKNKTKDKISKFTRLLTIIDVYHALISERPYHAKKKHKEAFFTIFMYRGKQFDEEILGDIIKKNGG